MDQALNSQKTPHTSPLRASYGMSFVSILMKNDRVIKGFYCSITRPLRLKLEAKLSMKFDAAYEEECLITLTAKLRLSKTSRKAATHKPILKHKMHSAYFNFKIKLSGLQVRFFFHF